MRQTLASGNPLWSHDNLEVGGSADGANLARPSLPRLYLLGKAREARFPLFAKALNRRRRADRFRPPPQPAGQTTIHSEISVADGQSRWNPKRMGVGQRHQTPRAHLGNTGQRWVQRRGLAGAQEGGGAAVGSDEDLWGRNLGKEGADDVEADGSNHSN